MAESEAYGLDDLLGILARLRDPDRGCPWDRQQDFRSLLPYVLEEAYEVAEAIDQGDMVALRDELGDLLFQIAFQARLGQESGHFDFQQIVDTICAKMIRRHPHVVAELERGDAAALNEVQEARRQAALQDLKARLTGRSDDLLSYEAIREMLRAEDTTHRRLQEIPLDAIVGSVGRYADFTRGFLPRQDPDMRT